MTRSRRYDVAGSEIHVRLSSLSKLVPAILCAQSGWAVFPIIPETKRPRWQWSTQATTSVSTVMDHWGAHPDDNIGVATKPSGLVVLDLDTGHAEHTVLGQRFHNGMQALTHICGRMNQPIPYTFRVHTPRGGIHLYFQAPTDIVITNRPLWGLAGLIDVRAAGGEHGGYVLGPGSTDDQGRRYTVDSYQADRPAPLPDWLRSMLWVPLTPTAASTLGDSDYAQPDDWDNLAEWLAGAPVGNRNNALFWAAARMYEGGASDDQVESLLLPVVSDLGNAAHSTIRSARCTVRGGR